MKKVFFLAVLLLFGAATFGQHIKQTNPRLIRSVPATAIDSPEAAPVLSGNALVNTKAILEDDLGQTRYDVQTNEAIANRFNVYDDGTMAGTWTTSMQDAGFTDRGTGYNYYNGTNWMPLVTTRIETIRTGWPTFDKWNANGEIVVAHQSATAALVKSTRPNKGTGAWTQGTIPRPPDYTKEMLWPRLMTSGPTNNYVHMIALTAPTGNSGAIYKGMDGCLLYYRSLDGGATWDKQGVQLPGLDSANYTNHSGDTYAWGKPHGDTIYFCMGGPYVDTFIMLSPDNGTTWTKIPILSNANKKIPAGVTYMPPWRSSDGAVACEMDGHGVIHFASGIGGGRMDGGSKYILLYFNGIIYWNTTMPMLRDSLDLDTLDAHGQLLGYYSDGPNPGDTLKVLTSYRTGLCTFPQISIDQYNNVYFLWSQVTWKDPDPADINYRHMYTRAWFSGQSTWSGDPIDLNDDILYYGQEFVFASMAKKIANNKMRMIYQTATQPGTAVGTTGTTGAIPFHDNFIQFREVPITQTFGPILAVYPPHREVGHAGGSTVFDVYSTAAWNASSNQGWCTVTLSGSGPGPLTATFGENTSGGPRTATITVTMSGASPVLVTLTQQSSSPTLTVEPANQNVPATPGGTTTFTVTSNSAWNASSDQGWCTVTPGGTGNGYIYAVYSENTSISPRVATITVTVEGLAPVHVTVSQAGAAPYLTVYPPIQFVPASAGYTTYSVYSNTTWATSSDQGWCTVTPGGTGDGTIIANFTENILPVQRVANITVSVNGLAPVVVILTQEAAIVGYTLDGVITYPNASATALSGITVNLKDGSGTVIGTTLTNGIGYFAFPNLSNGTYTLEMASTKAWGGVTALDVLLYKKHIANIAFLYGIFLASGDVNATGSLTAADVLLVKKRIGALINSFIVGDWLYNNVPVTISGSGVSVFFNGLCYGDANGSYTPPASKAVIPQQVPQEGQLIIGDIPGTASGSVSVPVYASGISNVGAFQFTIDYDPAVMTFTGTSGWFPGIDGVTCGEPSEGHLTFVWAADDRGINLSDATLFNLEFTLRNTGAGSAISWADTPTVREFAGWDGGIFAPSFVNGSLKVAATWEEILPVVTAYPNPASGYVVLKSNCTIRDVEVLSMVNQAVTGLHGIGSAQAKLDLSSLSPGLYFVRVSTEYGEQVVKVTVIW